MKRKPKKPRKAARPKASPKPKPKNRDKRTAKVVRTEVRALGRQEIVLQAIIAGATLEEAAAAAGYAGKQGAAKARDAALGELVATNRSLADEYRVQAEARLATAMKAIWPSVEYGIYDAIDRYVRLENRWSKLRGGDAPTRSEHTGANGGPIPVNLTGLTDVQLRRVAAGLPPGDPGPGDPRAPTEGTPPA